MKLVHTLVSDYSIIDPKIIKDHRQTSSLDESIASVLVTYDRQTTYPTAVGARGKPPIGDSGNVSSLTAVDISQVTQCRRAANSSKIPLEHVV